LIVFLTFYLLCSCNSSPDLQFESEWALTNIANASRILDQTKAVVSAAAVIGFVGLPHPVGDTLVNLIYFFM
jgi:hypothetical protein